jgi:hypothetical protein
MTKQEVSIIKIIKLVNGDDIVCILPKEQLAEKSPLLRVSKPLTSKIRSTTYSARCKRLCGSNKMDWLF